MFMFNELDVENKTLFEFHYLIMSLINIILITSPCNTKTKNTGKRDIKTTELFIFIILMNKTSLKS